MFDQAVYPVQHEQEFQELSMRIEAALAANRADLFLASVARKSLKIRQFDQVLARGLLGSDGEGLYSALPTSDQALIREKYLDRKSVV